MQSLVAPKEEKMGKEDVGQEYCTVLDNRLHVKGNFIQCQQRGVVNLGEHI